MALEFERYDPNGPKTQLELHTRAAERLDDQIDKSLFDIGKRTLALGRYMRKMKETGYYVLRGYAHWNDFMAAKGLDRQRSTIYEGMSIDKELCSGDNPVLTDGDLKDMTQENASGLAKLHKRGEKITAEIIESAKTLPIDRFKAEVVYPKIPALAQKAAIAQGRPLESGPEILTKITLYLGTDLTAQWNRCMEIARYVTRDSDSDTPFQEKAIESFLSEYEATWAATYEEAISSEEDQGMHDAKQTVNGKPVIMDDVQNDLDEEID